MIKVVFTYKTKTVDFPQLQEKLALSADPKFTSSVSNVKINLFSRVEDQDTILVLDIYYNSVEEYQARTEFERSQDDWNNIWFNPNNKHTQVSVEIFDVLN